MCGIAGYYGTCELSLEYIEKCLVLMKHRGPDGQYWIERKLGNGRRCYLLHSRLQIIDLDPRANQPFCRGKGLLCFNGEIYNYLELRQWLIQVGEKFVTESDTEVLAALLDRFDVSILDNCEGMWAFAWLTQDSLTICRDRFGEKPLYFFEDETGIYFGSEPKFIFALLGRKLPINLTHLYRYIIYGYKSLYKQPQNFFIGLQELKPATWLKVDLKGNSQNQSYWQPKFDQYKENLSFEEAVSTVQTTLIDAVKLRLRADVPIAFCLSGGVDSNALIAIASRRLNYQVHGFTIINTDIRYEERELVKTAVTELGLKHTEVPVDQKSFLTNLRYLIQYHDAPVYTITYYAHWQLMAAIAEAGYKVSVSGTGADELFSGYYDHHNFYLQMLEHDPITQSQARKNWWQVVAPIVRNPVLQDPDCFIKNPNRRDHIYLDAQVFAKFLKTPWEEKFREENYSKVLLRNRMNNELFHESVPPILHEDDLNAMYFSIENRSPFLDRHLFEVCQEIPTQYLIRDGKAKAVLREAVRGIAPDAVIENPRKVGFNVPIFDYLNVNDPQVCDQILDNSPIFDHIHREPIEQLIRQPDLPNSQSKFLFYFLNAKIFLEEFS